MSGASHTGVNIRRSPKDTKCLELTQDGAQRRKIKVSLSCDTLLMYRKWGRLTENVMMRKVTRNMVATYTYKTSKGYEFLCTFFDGAGDGVTVNPETAQLDNPDYLEALKEACEDYPSVYAYVSIANMAIYPFRENLKQEEDEWLSDVIRYKELVESSTSFEFNDVEKAFLLEVSHEIQRRIDAAEKKKRKPIKGYIYLIQSPTGAYKIGRTKNPDDRMKTFGIQLPFEVEYACLIPTDDMRSLERELHQQLADKRVNGEWFELSPDDVDYIKALAEAGL